MYLLYSLLKASLKLLENINEINYADYVRSQLSLQAPTTWRSQIHKFTFKYTGLYHLNYYYYRNQTRF